MENSRRFDRYIGIDYSGRGTPRTRTAALQIFLADGGGQPQRVGPAAIGTPSRKNWCRREVADWLVEQAGTRGCFIAGIDHAFSFPIFYFQQHQLRSWQDFLDDFAESWPTDRDHVTVDSIRFRDDSESTGIRDQDGFRGKRGFRLTETWTSSAKSVFQFDVQGSVAKSTHAGLPWLRRLRREVGHRIHFWPFDGWEVPAGKSVVAEVFPSIFRNRFPREGRTVDEQDAFSIARWLSQTDDRGCWDQYLRPLLTAAERTTAGLEGWILGIC